MNTSENNTIRNFAIIAHVDHGKSTLADRLLELTGTVSRDKHDDQLLDRNPISRERGITIKLAPVKMNYAYAGQEYKLHLIDTPGHVDFSYEVERTLACVEGAILLVDATQGIQAQTIAHTYKALEQNLIIVPAINKIDMPQAQTDITKQEIEKFLGIPAEDVHEISAKTGQGVEELLHTVIDRVPPPSVTDVHSPVRALIFDSYYDAYQGVIAFVRLFRGKLEEKDSVKLLATQTTFQIEEVGTFTPELVRTGSLSAGDVGYVVTKLKDIHSVHVGDTLGARTGDVEPIQGYRQVTPMVFSSMFPTDPDEYPDLRTALEKLMLNDSALQFEAIYSKALGSGFRVGFLGLLHADVVRQRLEQEYDMNIVLTAPTVEYRQRALGGKKRSADNNDGVQESPHGAGPSRKLSYEQSAGPSRKLSYEEPIVHVTIVTPQKYSGAVMQLCEESRGIFTHMDNQTHVVLEYDIPLAELIAHFFDRLKTVSSGFASLQWEFKEYRPVDVSRLDILLNQEPVEEFSEYVISEKAFRRGREITSLLKELIPRQQYEVKIQAQYKGKIVASTRLAPLRKDVTAKLYGGDRTRKDKLLKKQKEGKKKMKHIGSVEVPKEVFLTLFKKTG